MNVSKFADSILKVSAVNISELSSGWTRDKDAISKSREVMYGREYLQVGNKTYKAKGSVKGSQLTKGMVVLASYNQDNQGTQLCEILGVSDWEIPYGEGGVKFDSVKDAMRKAGVATLKDLDDKVYEQAKAKWGKDDGYGHGYYLWVKDLESKKSGGWFYLSEGRWTRGSGAERLSFVLMEETRASEARGASKKKAEKIDEYHTPQGIIVRVESESANYVVSLLSSGSVKSVMTVKYFPLGHIARATNFAKKLQKVLSSDPT